MHTIKSIGGQSLQLSPVPMMAERLVLTDTEIWDWLFTGLRAAFWNGDGCIVDVEHVSRHVAIMVHSLRCLYIRISIFADPFILHNYVMATCMYYAEEVKKERVMEKWDCKSKAHNSLSHSISMYVRSISLWVIVVHNICFGEVSVCTVHDTSVYTLYV